MFANAKYRALLLPTLAVAAILLILAALLLGYEPAGAQSGAPTVTAVAVTSDAGNDDTYLLGDVIQVTLTFSQAVNVTGTPSLKIDMDPGDWGEKSAAYESGSGSTQLVFAHEVVEPNLSTQGIAVLADSLALNGGAIQSAGSDTDADLSHAALAHDASHKVNWQISAPTVSAVAITSDAGDDDTYGEDDAIQITLTFSEAVDVTGTPQLSIDMDPAEWGEKPAAYESGSGSTALVFTHTVVEPNLSTQGIAVLENTLALNGGSIQSASSQIDASLSHAGLGHDASHKVDWQQTEPNHAPVINTQSAGYADFNTRGNAPRGYLVSKRFDGIFSDPDGDELTYSVALASDNRRLVEELRVGDFGESDAAASQSGYPLNVVQRVYFTAEAEADWKAMSPRPPDLPVATVTLTATDPGGLTASVEGDFLIRWAAHPELVSAVAREQSIELTFDMALEETPGPKPKQFTVHVVNADGTAGTIAVSGVSINGSVVTLELGSELSEGQTVTLDYAYNPSYDGEASLRRAGGGVPAYSFTGQAVDMAQLAPPGAVANLAVSAEPGMKDVLAMWDAVEGATSYKLRWRKVDGEFEAANAATVSGAPLAIITVSGYGQWEAHVQACNDAGCGPEVSGTVDAVQAASLNLERSGSRTITATWDAVPDAASYTLRWERLGTDAPSSAQPDAAAPKQTRAVDGVSGDSGPGANVQTSGELTVPADRTDAELSVPDGGAYRVELKAVDDGNELVAMANRNVDQMPGQPDTTPPEPERGEIDGNRVTIYFSEPLDEDATGGFFDTILDNFRYSGSIGPSALQLEVSGNKVTGHLRRIRVEEEGWSAAASYFVDTTDEPLRDIAGNPVRTPHRVWNWVTTRYWLTTRYIGLQNLTGLPKVTDVAISSDAGDDGAYAKDDVIQITVTFSEAVDVTGTPRLRIDLDRGDGGEKWARYANGSGAKELKFSYTVMDGDLSTEGVAVLENTLELRGGTIRAAVAATTENAQLAHDGLRHDSAHKVVTPGTSALAPQSASVTGAALTITFSEALGAAASLSNDAFTVKKTPQGGSEQTVSLSGSPAVSGSTLTLTLASAVLATDVGVKVSYAKPATGSNNKLIDAGGNAAADFAHESVVNTLDATRPKLVRGEVNGDVITLYFSEPMDENSGGDGVIFLMRLVKSDFRLPSYGKCDSGYVVTNFTVKPRQVIVKGNTVTLVELGHGYERSTPRQRAKLRSRVGYRSDGVSYFFSTDSNAQVLQDLAGNALGPPGPGWLVLDNVTQLPSPERATVDGDRLTLNFSAPMDEDLVPAASAFTVKKTPQGSVTEQAVSLASDDPVDVYERTVTLTLASAVASTDTVTVSYAKPGSNWLRNVICEYAPSFTDQAVTNSTP